MRSIDACGNHEETAEESGWVAHMQIEQSRWILKKKFKLRKLRIKSRQRWWRRKWRRNRQIDAWIKTMALTMKRMTTKRTGFRHFYTESKWLRKRYGTREWSSADRVVVRHRGTSYRKEEDSVHFRCARSPAPASTRARLSLRWIALVAIGRLFAIECRKRRDPSTWYCPKIFEGLRAQRVACYRTNGRCVRKICARAPLRPASVSTRSQIVDSPRIGFDVNHIKITLACTNSFNANLTGEFKLRLDDGSCANKTVFIIDFCFLIFFYNNRFDYTKLKLK